MPEGPTLPEQRVWCALRGELAAGRPVALAAVVSHRGSSPGRTGWLLAIGTGGRLAGTTGGGVAEVAVVEGADELLARDAGVGRRGSAEGGRLLPQTHRAEAEHASGLLCGGEQVVALVRLDADAAPAVGAVEGALARGDAVWWEVSPAGLRNHGPDEAVSESPDPVRTGFTQREEGSDWVYRHLSGPSHRVVLVGAGHVGEALARALVPLGFRVEVVDERPGAADRLRGRTHGVRTLAYERVADAVAPGDETFVVVATHAPERDAAAVGALAGVRVGYLGVVGNSRKLAHLGEVPRLEVPAGVPIGSHAPAEIAVSVAARLVAVRSGHVVR